MLVELEAQVRATRSLIDRQSGEVASIAARGQRVLEEVQRLTSEVALYERVGLLLSQIGEDRQDDAQRKIEALVTRGLQAIFGEELSFHVVQSTRAKQAQVDFVVRSTLPGGEVVDTSVMDARGGGLAAVVGFLLRLVVMLLSMGRQESVLLLDETFSMVSSEYLGRLSEFLREIVDKTGVQIIMVTHQDALTETADRVYRFQLDSSGRTSVS